MKNLYYLFLTMLLAFVGYESAWADIAEGNYYLKHKESGLYLYNDTYLSLGEKSGAAVFHVYEEMGYYVFKTTEGDYLNVYEDRFPEISDTKDWLILKGTIDNFSISCFTSEKYLSNFDNYLDTSDTPEYWELEAVSDDSGSTTPSSYQADILGKGDDGFYGTFYAEHACEIPNGYTAYVVADVNNGNIELSSIVSGNGVKGNVLAANTPVIIKGAEGTITLSTAKTGGNNAATNLLAGSLVNNETVTEEGYKYYKLAYDSNGKNLGFYWEQGTGGNSISTRENKAYLRVPISQASSNALSFRFEDNLTGIVSVSTPQNAEIYNLQGQRAKGNAAGVYIKNGKKFIVK